MTKSLHFVLMTLALLVAAIQAQQINGNLEGRILDSPGQPLAEVNISATGPNLQGVRGGVNDKLGYFRILALPVGPYTVKISRLGYQPVTYENVLIRLGKTTTLVEVRLQAKTLEMPEVVVSGAKPLIDPASTATGANLAADKYEILPLQRNYRSITTLLPQANTSFLGDEANFSGATGLENKYFIDGVDVTDPYRGMTGTNLPYNFVKEIEVRTGGYEAEYRSALGGVVNVITYAGGNDLRGQAFGFFANNRFAGDPRQGALEPGKGDFVQYDIGLSLGGPFIRDKVWFFAAYNPTVEREEVEIPGTGFYNDKNTTHIFAGKITWRATEKNNLIMTIMGDPSNREAVGETYGSFGTPSVFANPDPYLAELRTGGINLLLNGNHVLSNWGLIETSLARMTRKDQYLPAIARGRNETTIIDRQTGLWSGGYPSRVDNLSVQSTAAIKGMLIFGKHIFKTGFEYKDNRLDDNRRSSVISRFGAASYLHFLLSINGTVHNRIPSLFVQDSWRISDRLRLNAGLRWDGQFLVGSDGKVAQKITDQYQPRIGFVFQPGEIGSQKISGSFGRFYQKLSTYLSSTFQIEGRIFDFINYDHDPRIDPSGGDTLGLVGAIQPEAKNLQGQHYDEFTLGYERQAGRNFKIGARGVYRTLRQAIEDGFVPAIDDFHYGNPGKGELSIYPRVKREYAALELIAEKSGDGKFNFLSSYVLSRNYGNYPGLFNSDFNYPFPNANGSFDMVEMLINGAGLLPNDRTHVFKFSGSYCLNWGLTFGTSLSWQSGTPLSELGGTSAGRPFFGFVRQRGTAGRTPSIWDLNLRLVYNLSRDGRASFKPRLILDAFHLGSRRTPVNFEQIHYFNLDANGKQKDPNPIYGRATRYQPPMAVRLGLEVGF